MASGDKAMARHFIPGAESATLKTVDRQAPPGSSTARHCAARRRDPVAVNRFHHDPLAARLAEHLGKAIAVSQ
jgi:hypothetical protein